MLDMARPFDAELAALESLRDSPPAATLEPLRKALASKNNFLAAKAAKLAVLHEHSALVDALAGAFPRFLGPNSPKADPQCWAKNAIAQALAHFEYQDSALFLQGMRHVQPEPVWGGSEDTAGTLRGVCALALVQCRELNSHQVLLHLLPLFADKQTSVQVNAARAVEQIGNDSSALLLRLRAELASSGPELLSACYSGVLRLEGPAAIPWAAKFLALEDEPATEAAFAIAETRTDTAATLLVATHRRARDPDFRDSLLTALALTRLDAALEYLFTLVEDGSTAAREAIVNSAPGPSVLERLERLKR